jgi:DeoR/GlpR family transcriptional regulator of sugar metabolism
MGVIGCILGRSAQIIEHAREHGRVAIGDIVRLTGISRNTIKPHFRRLLADGNLVLRGSGRGAWYAFP